MQGTDTSSDLTIYVTIAALPAAVLTLETFTRGGPELYIVARHAALVP